LRAMPSVPPKHELTDKIAVQEHVMDSSERKPWTPPDLHAHAPESPRAFMLNFSSVEEGHVYKSLTRYETPIPEVPQFELLSIGQDDARVERLPGSNSKGLIIRRTSGFYMSSGAFTFDTWYRTLSATIFVDTTQFNVSLYLVAWEVDVEPHATNLTVLPGQNTIQFDRLFPQLSRIRQIQFSSSNPRYSVGIDTIFGFE
jgi:hypothetical protein